jgi:hypothetical protein
VREKEETTADEEDELQVEGATKRAKEGATSDPNSADIPVFRPVVIGRPSFCSAGRTNRTTKMMMRRPDKDGGKRPEASFCCYTCLSGVCLRSVT